MCWKLKKKNSLGRLQKWETQIEFVCLGGACVGVLQVNSCSLFAARGFLTLPRPHTHARLNLLKMFALLNVVLSFWQPAFHGLTAEVTICISLLGLARRRPLSRRHLSKRRWSRRVMQRQKECRTPAKLHILLAVWRNGAKRVLHTSNERRILWRHALSSHFHVACRRPAPKLKIIV